MTERALILAAILAILGVLWLRGELRRPPGVVVDHREPPPPAWVGVSITPGAPPAPEPQHVIHQHEHTVRLLPPDHHDTLNAIERRRQMRATLERWGVDTSDLPALPEQVIDGEVIA